MITSDMGESRLIECAASGLPRMVDNDLHRYAGFLTIIEEDFQCAGVCNPSKFYLFTDVDRGVPTETCRRAIAEKLGAYMHPKGWAMILTGGMGFVGCLMAFCIFNIRRSKQFMPLFAYNSSEYWRSLAKDKKDSAE